MTQHVYMGLENISLNAAQKNQLVTALQQLGPIQAANPAHRNHWRVRLDGNAVLFEALFDDDDLTVASVKGYLASIFNIQASSISHTLTTPTFAARPTPVATFRYNGTDYLRVAVFGGPTATWAQSREETLAYLAANAAAWEAAEG